MRSIVLVIVAGLMGCATALGASPDVDLPDANGMTPLMQATVNGKIDDARALLARGASLEAQDAQQYNAMDYAMERYQLEVVQALISAAVERASPGDRARAALAAVLTDAALPKADSYSPEVASYLLLLAAARGQAANVERLLAAGVAADAGIGEGYSALAMAARWGRNVVVTQLLAAGADPNGHTNTRYRTTPLMEASRDGRVVIAEQLIDAGAEVNEPDRHGDHALNWAAYFGHAEFVALMVHHGADLKRTGQTDDQPIEIAIREKHDDVVRILSTAGAVPRRKK